MIERSIIKIVSIVHEDPPSRKICYSEFLYQKKTVGLADRPSKGLFWIFDWRSGVFFEILTFFGRKKTFGIRKIRLRRLEDAWKPLKTLGTSFLKDVWKTKRCPRMNPSILSLFRLFEMSKQNLTRRDYFCKSEGLSKMKSILGHFRSFENPNKI